MATSLRVPKEEILHRQIWDNRLSPLSRLTSRKTRSRWMLQHVCLSTDGMTPAQERFVCSSFVWSLGLSAAFNYRWLQNRLQSFKDAKAWHASTDRSGVLDTVDVPTCCKLCVCKCVSVCVCEIPFTLFKNISAWKHVSVNVSVSSLELKHIFAPKNQAEAFLGWKHRSRWIQHDFQNKRKNWP